MSPNWKNRAATHNRRSNHYPQFSESEYERRRTLVREMMDEEDLDALAIFGNASFQQVNISYLTDYRPPFATYFLFFADPTEPSLLLVGLSNHVQYVREVSEADEIDIMLPDPGEKVANRFEGTDAASGRVGLVGYGSRYDLTLPHQHQVTIEDELDGELVDATADFEIATSVRSEEELDRIRRAAELTDAGMEAIAEAAAPDVREADLQTALKRRYLEGGGSEGVTFISSASMEDAEPGEPLPWKHPSDRELEEGDVITTEVSAASAGYRSQIHRPFTVGRSPTSTYRELFDIAEETYERMIDALQPGNTTADVHQAVAPIEESEYKVYDVLLHGYGNGYQPPFVGTETSNYWPGGPDQVTAEWTFRENQVMVVQPNVVTEDERHGLQLGTAVIVTGDGPEVLQQYPVEFQQV